MIDLSSSDVRGDFAKALSFFCIEENTNDDYVLNHKEELISCMKAKADLIDFDCLTTLEDIIGNKVSYKEYSTIDKMFQNTILEYSEDEVFRDIVFQLHKHLKIRSPDENDLLLCKRYDEGHLKRVIFKYKEYPSFSMVIAESQLPIVLEHDINGNIYAVNFGENDFVRKVDIVEKKYSEVIALMDDKEYTYNEALRSNTRKAFFSIKDIDDFPFLEGYTYGTLWNGWACPLFSKEEIDKNISKMRIACNTNENNFYYDEKSDSYIVKFEDEDSTISKGSDRMTSDGNKHLYDLGSFSWIWNEFDESEKINYEEEEEME